MNTYIVKVDLTHECEVREYRIFADAPWQALLEAGVRVGAETEGANDEIILLSVDKVTEAREKVWP